jgi:cyclophilin family peptidyl-prolyl cis-trans isomerase
MPKSKEKTTTKDTISTSSSNLFNTVFSIITMLVLATGFLYYSYSVLPKALDQTEEAKTKKYVKDLEDRKGNEDKRKADRQKELLDKDPENLKFENSAVDMKTNFGSLKIDLKYAAAPKTTESFVRLTTRKYFDKIDFHRYVKGEGFTVIQGGDPTGTGTGGASAFGDKLPDEIFKVAPVKAEDGSGLISNDPEFIDPSLYSSLNKEKGTVTYKKGLIIMANSGPNTGGSQFFITLTDTTLPPAYTTFGVVRPESFGTLDKIFNDVGVIEKNQGTQGYESTTKDGKPDKELYIETVRTI